MNVFAIESSCDETSASVVRDGKHILSNVIASQDDLHSPFGGVVPELASRRHAEIIDNIAEQALESAAMGWDDIDLLAVTQGPGLVGSLIIGISYVLGVSYRYNIPVVGINHLEAHLNAGLIGKTDVEYPVLGLIVSGGHTLLIKMDDVRHYKKIGTTLDDAAGEAFDKVAMMMRLGYPGGPKISKIALSGDRKSIKFPQGLIRSSSFDFSFSGVKTAVLYQLKSEKQPVSEQRKADIAASFQYSAVSVLVKKTMRAAKHYNIKTITAGGGVTCNPLLRDKLKYYSDKYGYRLVLSDPQLCTDNAAMIGALAYFYRDKAVFAKNTSLDPMPNMVLI